MAIAKKHNIVLHRWSTVHNIFILKQKGNIKSHRLRFLHKLESELNTAHQELITRRIMPQAEKLKHLSEDQHGGRNGRGAVDIALGKVFKYETFHFQRSNIACTDCDAKACYDQIIPLVLLLTYVKLGLP